MSNKKHKAINNSNTVIAAATTNDVEQTQVAAVHQYSAAVENTALEPASKVNLFDDSNGSMHALNFGDTTRDNTPTITGHAAPGTQVIVSDEGHVLGVADVKSDGTWSYTADTLADGNHVFSVVVSNPATGEKSISTVGINFIVDTHPLVSGSENFDNQHAGVRFYDGDSLTFASGLTLTAEGTDREVSVISSGFMDRQDNMYGDNHEGGISNQGGEGSILFTLPGSAQSISFDYAIAQEITVYDTHNNVIDHVIYTMETWGNGIGDAVGVEWLQYDYTAPQGVEIGSFSVDGGYCWVDNVAWSDTNSTTWSQSSAITNEAYDLSNHGNNTLTLTHADLLNHVHENLYMQDGHKQAAINGNAGDVVQLKLSDFGHEHWSETGHADAGGVHYDVYQHASDNLELLVEHGVQLHQMMS